MAGWGYCRLILVYIHKTIHHKCPMQAVAATTAMVYDKAMEGGRCHDTTAIFYDNG